MTDFVEWFDGTGGGADEMDDDLLQDIGLMYGQRAERDAVLFLVDCSANMFHDISQHEDSTVPGAHCSPFSRAIQCALAFYQEKVITSDKDLVALVLYNTRKKLNVYEFNGIYVFHEFDCPGAARVQELQVLSKSGTGDATVIKEFHEHIGIAPPRTSLLSEALWAAQHMYHSLRTKSVGYRRVFLFTATDDPCMGLPMERERCYARMKDLHDAGVALEVFAHGAELRGPAIVCPSTAPSSSSAGTLPPSSRPLAVPSVGSHGGAFMVSPAVGLPDSLASSKVSATPADAIDATISLGSSTHFIRSKFWDSLLTSPIAALQGRSSTPGSSLEISPSDSEYTGTVHVSSGLTSFDAMVSDVKIRTHPQRSSGSCGLRIGFGPHCPKAIVNLYIPALKCPKPKFRWLDGMTNTAVTSETRILSKATGGAIDTNDIRFSTTVAGEEVTFSKEERQRMKDSCASSTVGLTILGFKRQEDAIRFKYCVSRCAFVHCTSQKGGGEGSLKFFVQLYRTLSAQRKVAIAEFVSRAGVAPRLVALLPSTLIRDVITVDSVSGLGFHLVHIPYADDIRSFHPEPFPAEGRPSDDQITKAKRVIRKLQVDYDVNAIANPALQRQYKLLQQLALIDPISLPIDDLTLPDVEGMKKVAPLMSEFNVAIFPSTYHAEMICPQPKPAKKPPSAAEMRTINFDELEKAGKLDSLTIPYLAQYLKLLKEDAQGAKLKHELVARVVEVVKKRRGIKREREDD